MRVLDPVLLVIVKGVNVTLGAPEPLDRAENLPREPAQNTSENGERNTGQELRNPRITHCELEDTIQDPDTI
ncbi:hypothetical protein HG531_002201 [Fusarium graminearum]|nr:hypothetical protein HG531_002201 [Fusarium graminearum]